MFRTRLTAALFCIIATGLCLTPPLRADVKLPAVLSDNMCIQQDLEVPIWGTADPGEQVTVTLNDQSPSTTADQNGRWMVRLKPVKAGGPVKIAVHGNNDIEINNVLIGEAW